MLQKDPAQRPQSAAEIVERLGRALPSFSARLSAVMPASPRMTQSRPVITPAPRPARAMTPMPGTPSMISGPTTIGPSTSEQLAAAAPRSRTGLWIVLIALVVAGAAGALALGMGGGGEEKQPAAEPAAAPPAEPVEQAPEDILVSLTLDPAEATVTVDGAAVDAPGGLLRLPRDGATHKIEVSAPGHVTRSFPLKADRDQSASIALAPAPVVTPPPVATTEPKPEKKPDKKSGKKSGKKGGKKDGKKDGGGPLEESL
jgi:serine/threonine-protein kinase